MLRRLSPEEELNRLMSRLAKKSRETERERVQVYRDGLVIIVTRGEDGLKRAVDHVLAVTAPTDESQADGEIK